MGGGWFVGEGLGACDTASSEAEESVVYRVEVMKEKDDLYAKEDFTEEDGLKAGELEATFAEMEVFKRRLPNKN